MNAENTKQLSQENPIDEFNELEKKLSLSYVQNLIFEEVKKKFLNDKELKQAQQLETGDKEKYKHFFVQKLVQLVETEKEGSEEYEFAANFLKSLLKHTFIKSNDNERYVDFPERKGVLYVSDREEVVLLKDPKEGMSFREYKATGYHNGSYRVFDYKSGIVLTGERKGVPFFQNAVKFGELRLAPGDIGYEDSKRLEELEKVVHPGRS